MQPSQPRVVMIGESFVGKSSLVFQMCEGKWIDDTKPTVATAYYELAGDAELGQASIQIWDTAGAERYRALNSVYYHNAMGAVLVFDVTCRESFEALDSWFDEFRSIAEPNAVVALAGNKVDVREASEEGVRAGEGEKWAKGRGVRYFETSARDGTGVAGLSAYLLEAVGERSAQEAHSLDITRAPPEEKGKCC